MFTKDAKPLNFFRQVRANPDKLIAEATKQLGSETFSSRMHLRYQKERKIELKLSRFKLDLGGEQEKL